MNWKIGFMMWLKGVGIFGIACLPFLGLGLWAFVIALMVSWVAIPVYAISLWLLKEAHFPHKLSMTLMMVLSTPSSVLAALWFLKTIDKEMASDGEGFLFWVPLFCCILSMIFSNNSIYCYLDPKSVAQEFATE